MPSTTDFNDWLQKHSANLKDHNTLSALYDTICTLTPHGEFSIKNLNGKDDQWIVSGGEMEIDLVLLSEDARKAFLRILDSNTPDKIGVEAITAFERNVEKDD